MHKTEFLHEKAVVFPDFCVGCLLIGTINRDIIKKMAVVYDWVNILFKIYVSLY